jgi:hypothetical protein
MAEQILKTTKRQRLDIVIDPKIFDELVDFQKKLPNEATGASKKGGAPNYHDPAGLALLGIKEDKIDMVVPLKMSGGCWDAPNINYEDMYKGFQALLNEEHICAGMALVRNPRWNTNKGSDDAKMPPHLKYQLHTLRKSFSDITKTLWVVVHNGYFRTYRPTQEEGGRVGCREIAAQSLFEKDEIGESKLVKNKLDRDNKKKEERKKIREERLAYARKEEARLAKIEAERIKAHNAINEKIKEKKESEITLGEGFYLMKDKNGKYILWKK